MQFLEQSGVRVVPIDYTMSEEEIESLLNQVNGVYMPGDSQVDVDDAKYRQSFVTVMMYAEQLADKKKEHFPVFLMGNSLNSYIKSKSTFQKTITEMKGLEHTNSRVQLLGHPNDTFLFHNMSREDKQAVFNTAQFFNMQTEGVQVGNLSNVNSVDRRLKPIAVYSSHDIENEAEQYIAIAEGKDMPLYAFTYAVEAIQFYFEDPTATLDNFVLDHSIIARKHAQTVANLIAEEARLSNHTFDIEEEVFERLVRH